MQGRSAVRKQQIGVRGSAVVDTPQPIEVLETFPISVLACACPMNVGGKPGSRATQTSKLDKKVIDGVE